MGAPFDWVAFDAHVLGFVRNAVGEGVTVGRTEPSENTYPFVRLGEIVAAGVEEDAGLGSTPGTHLTYFITITTWQGSGGEEGEGQGFEPQRSQAFAILGKLQQAVRDNRRLGGYDGIEQAAAGGFSAGESEKAFYTIQTHLAIDVSLY